MAVSKYKRPKSKQVKAKVGIFLQKNLKTHREALIPQILMLMLGGNLNVGGQLAAVGLQQFL
jgi:hypothetical protein